MVKKIIANFAPIIAVLFIFAGMFLPVLILPFLIAASIILSLGIALKPGNIYFSILLAIASMVGAYFLFDSFSAIFIPLLCFPVGLSVGFCFTKKYSLKDTTFYSVIFFFITLAAGIFIYTYLETSAFDPAAAFKPIAETLKEFLREIARIICKEVPGETITEGTISQYAQQLYNTLISFIPAICVILELLQVVINYYSVRSYLSNDDAYDTSHMTKFSDTHIDRLFMIPYIAVIVLSLIFSLIQMDNVINTFTANLCVIGTLIYAYDGLALIRFVSSLQAATQKQSKLIFIYIFMLLLICSAGIYLLAVFAIIFDSLLDLRSKARARKE